MGFGNNLKTWGMFAAPVVVVVGLAIPGVEFSEGTRLNAYRDPVGIPTICMGETKGVKMGDTKTLAECQAMLGGRLAEFLGEMRACTNVKLPAKTEAALLEFTYNVGSGTYCKNIAAKRLNKGKYVEACQALKLYVKGGRPLRTLPGLVTRRERESKACLEGLAEAGLINKVW